MGAATVEVATTVMVLRVVGAEVTEEVAVVTAEAEDTVVVTVMAHRVGAGAGGVGVVVVVEAEDMEVAGTEDL
jgi:hypothetical protein